MKTSIPSAIFLSFLCVITLFVAGCSDPQKQARKALEERGYSASVKDMVTAASVGDLESLELFLGLGMDIDATEEIWQFFSRSDRVGSPLFDPLSAVNR